MTTELDKIKHRILALSEKTVQNGCTEQEALAAMNKVGELLAVYNLSMSDIQVEEEICIERKVHLGRLTIPRWAFVFSQIGQFTQTKAWVNAPNVHYFGFEPDVQMAEYLTNIVLTAMDVETKKFKKSPAYQHPRRRMTNSFKLGLAQRLSQRMKAPPGKGIILHKLAVIEERLPSDLRLRRRPAVRVRYDKRGYEAGRAAAEGIELVRSLS